MNTKLNISSIVIIILFLFGIFIIGFEQIYKPFYMSRFEKPPIQIQTKNEPTTTIPEEKPPNKKIETQQCVQSSVDSKQTPIVVKKTAMPQQKPRVPLKRVHKKG
jgi:hypothetical protein